MGMAYKAPAAIYKAKFIVTEYCVEKYREHVEAESKALRLHDLARLLDERIDDALRAGRMSDITDSDAPAIATKIACVESRNGRRCYVVLRPYEYKSTSVKIVVSPPVERGALMTILVVGEEFGNRKMISGAWTPANRPFAEKLAKIEASAPKPTVDPVVGRPPGTDPGPQLVKEEPKPVVEEPKPELAKNGRTRQSYNEANKRPPNSMSREAIRERMDFARHRLMLRPFMPMGGPDGLKEMLRKRFGIALDMEVLNSIRAECQAARGHQPEPPRQGGYQGLVDVKYDEVPVDPVRAERAIIDRPVVPPAYVPPPPAPMPVRDATPPLAIRLAAAHERETKAREVFNKLHSEMEAARAEAEAAQREVDDLMAEFQASRGGRS